jgi:diaminohydroxyphosphoribosylaminopyrimidine deaminase/5-amino-6-(5-phosphoribosylamino)uracil reductase
MQRCLQLALKGAGWVAPNPMVGAVLVYQDQIIGEGYHAQYGQAHAEVNCINSVAEKNREKIKASTLYVSLEPCVHFGKTPPCTNLIIAHQIKKVVIGCMDPFDAVNGKGATKLMQEGVEVIGPVLENECKDLNKRFFNFHLNKRPYIILKWAQTADEVIGVKGQEIKISNSFTQRLVHTWRSEEAAILVGTQTAITDNPQLNTRFGLKPNPLRMVIDRTVQLNTDLNLLNDQKPTWVFNTIKDETKGSVNYIQLREQPNLLKPILQYAYEHQVQSILVEGGAKLLQGFISQALWDEARVIKSSHSIGTHYEYVIQAPRLFNANLMNEAKLGTDIIQYYKRNLL